MKRLLLGVVSAGLLLLGASSASAATTPTPSLNSIGVCGNSTTSYSDTLQHVDLTGDVYVRLNNASEATVPATVYFQSFQDGVCHAIGTATAQYGQWAKVGSYSGAADQSGSLVVNAVGLGAAPYSAVAQVLILPDPSLCTPVLSCNVTYQGYSAVLQPQILSTAADQLNVYLAKPIAGVGYSKVSYYADSQYMYGGTILGPFNRDYLSGGTHNITVQVSLKNGQTLTINQVVNMGLDITTLFFFRSLIYKSHDKALLVVIAIAILVILSLLGWIIQLIRRHRASIRDHGFDHTPTGQWVEPKDKDQT